MKNKTKAKKLIFGSIFICLVVLISISPVSAYTLNNLWWQYENAAFTTDSSVPSSWSYSITQSLSEWNDADSDFYFYQLGGQNNKFLYDSLGSTTTTLATTKKWKYTDTSYLSRCEITFNSDKSWSTTGESTKFDVQSAATHELGHCLSLGHSGVTDATMYDTMAKGETKKRTLHADDECGIIAIYGNA
ncbi:hypothetical protein LI82_12305 [Methanococcoides methylutens]|uniref:Peptidase M10 metallopeptidase domain-containing protein n=1 Tax=Methanococcoides methylutens TaxID=2226 RepID=A0A099T002_METMT|nr:matrixin family metalloprotease [Methanococcoides methylutens]KGK98472.1 hypothetical protein LI82_12305 [Methanococcoides methylutens]